MPCRAATIAGESFCSFHNPSTKAAFREGRRRGASAPKKKTIRDRAAIKLDTATAVLKLAETTLAEIRAAGMPPGELARATSRLLRIALEAQRRASADGSAGPSIRELALSEIAAAAEEIEDETPRAATDPPEEDRLEQLRAIERAQEAR